MTHEELLAKIDSFSCCSGAQELALRAVVELHRPLELVSSSMCLECSSDDSVVSYPCPTINNIEKELQ
jgi:hypothetical protein